MVLLVAGFPKTRTWALVWFHLNSYFRCAFFDIIMNICKPNRHNKWIYIDREREWKKERKKNNGKKQNKKWKHIKEYKSSLISSSSGAWFYMNTDSNFHEGADLVSLSFYCVYLSCTQLSTYTKMICSWLMLALLFTTTFNPLVYWYM